MTRRTEASFSAESVLAGLKRFQRQTAEYVFKRMYLDEDQTTRFLIADEVGLGKTLVAKGVIAKASEHLKREFGKDYRVDIVYICSNASIASQNISRLNIFKENAFSLASRITLLPLQNLNKSPDKINFVSFTPATSFDQKSSIGLMHERALLHRMLKDPWNLKGAAPYNVLQGNVRDQNYFRQIAQEDRPLNEDITKRFNDMVTCRQYAKLRDNFDQICFEFRNARKTRRPLEQREKRNSMIGELRAILAEACIDSLEPDIIILDEFQRFKHLLSDTDECSRLARRLFEYADKKKNTRARVLLLSATPYKMYTLHNEARVEDHYSDFIRTYKFLERNSLRQSELETLLGQFRDCLLSSEQALSRQTLDLKNRIEILLRKVMVRTERLASSDNRNGMLKEIEEKNQCLDVPQILSYVTLDRMAAQLGAPNMMEYWKSAPYLLNFMDDYKLKNIFDEKLDDHKVRTKALRTIANNADTILLSEDDIRGYKPVNPCNARLDAFFRDVLDNDAWKTLWIPPSLPYYRLEEPFYKVSSTNFTKRLVFSTWKVVPKAIAVMMSYEVERRMNTLFRKGSLNTMEARKRRRPLLRFAVSDKRETGMPIMGLIYPCITMARDCDPLKTMAQFASSDNLRPTLDDILSATKTQIDTLLQGIGDLEGESRMPDESWYWAAPVLMDEANAKTVGSLLDPEFPAQWARRDGDNEDESDHERDDATHFDSHVAKLRTLVEQYRAGNLKMGRKPDDLLDVLSLFAVAAPATCMLRSLSRRSESLSTVEKLWINAAQVGFAFIRIFNSPDVTSLIRGMYPEEPYWCRVLEYCAKGCLQSTLDEYVHVLRESLGLFNESAEEAAKKISDTICQAVSLQTVHLNVDNIDRVNLQKNGRIEGLGRVHFALRFGEERGDDGKIVTRSDQVKDSFNSPFWPFVLATTSIGQEGLDFHQYCHAVVHWNLPSNPVDLEQREGRIHRYKNHAVRKNLASQYGCIMRNAVGDVWEAMFLEALNDYGKGSDDIKPFWVFPCAEGSDGAYIERHIPALAFSRDIDKSALLKKSLAIYRLVFGQTQQEDIVEYLLSNYGQSESDKKNLRNIPRIDLSPRHE